MINALFNQNYQKYTFFVKQYIILNSYVISFSGFRIGRSKLVLNSKNLLRIPYLAC